MEPDGRAAAVAEFRKAMGGRSAQDIADDAGIPDAATVRAFVNGDTWPWSKTRKKLEEAVGWEAGRIEAIARGDVDLEVTADVDPVEVAIEASALTRGNKKRLIGTYYDMLDAQQERGAS